MKKQTIEKAPARPESETIEGFHLLKGETIQRDERQPRKTFDETKLNELAESIRDLGIVEPLVVRYEPQAFTLHEPDLMDKEKFVLLDRAGVEVYRGSENHCILHAGGMAGLEPTYVLVAGERRHRAAEIAGLEMLPCMVRVGMEAREIAKIQFAENDGREAITPMDEAEHFYDLVRVRKLFTADELAEELKKSRSHIFGRLKLAELPKAIKNCVRDSNLNSDVAMELAKVPGEKNQMRAMKEILGSYEDSDEGMSVREARRYLKTKYMLDLMDAAFDRFDAELVPGAGSCQACPKRSGNCKDLFPELKSPDVCTDPDCFQKKLAAHVAKAIGQAERDGFEVVKESEGKKMFKYSAAPALHGTDFITLSNFLPGDKKRRSIQQVLGKDAPKALVVISPRGDAFQIHRREEVIEALKAKGVMPEQAPISQGGMAYEPPTAEFLRKQKQEQALTAAVDNALALAVIEKAEQGRKNEKVWLLKFTGLLLDLLSECGHEWESPLARRGIAPDNLSSLDEDQLRGLLVELLMTLEYAECWDQNMVDKGVKHFDVDAKKVTKEAKAKFEEDNALPKDGGEYKVGRAFLDGPVDDSCSVEHLMEDKIKGVFSWRGRDWVKVGGCSSGAEGTIYAKAIMVVSASEFKGTTETYKTRHARIGMKEHPDRGSYDRQPVKLGGKDFVLCKPQVKLIPDKPLEKVKGKKMSTAARANLLARTKARWKQVKAKAKAKKK